MPGDTSTTKGVKGGCLTLSSAENLASRLYPNRRKCQEKIEVLENRGFNLSHEESTQARRRKKRLNSLCTATPVRPLIRVSSPLYARDGWASRTRQSSCKSIRTDLSGSSAENPVRL